MIYLANMIILNNTRHYDILTLYCIRNYSYREYGFLFEFLKSILTTQIIKVLNKIWI